MTIKNTNASAGRPSEGAWSTSQARSRTGALAVVTTDAGLPLSIRIDNSELARHPQVIADEILRLCRQSAMAAAIRLRTQLLESGAPREVVDALELPSADDLARAEECADQGADAPASWLRSI